MNVLILTPDAVGSTLLQRLLTIYMQFHTFDHPVINIHELTNGIDKFWSPDFNREILGKPNFLKGKKWGYYQSLQEIIDLLSTVDHYKTARLSAYHIQGRKDSIEQQLPFYQYLNENFFVISCRRRNVFEYGLSWAINKISNKLNVFNTNEKVSAFIKMYKDPINVDTESLVVSLDAYCVYLKWAENHFNVASYFYYDQHVENIERYILDLPIFSGQQKLMSWKENFGQEFNDWNRCHYMMADIGTLALEHKKETHNLLLAGPSKNIAPEFALIDNQSKTVVSHLPADHQEFLKINTSKYLDAKGAIDKMLELGILVTGVPIKKQTMLEKKHIVKNFDECVDVYNKWANSHLDIAQPIDLNDLQSKANQEQDFWQPQLNLIKSTKALPD